MVTPRLLFELAFSPEVLLNVMNKVTNVIYETQDLAGALIHVNSNPQLHCAFETYPSPETRYWESSLTRPVSDWSMCQMVAELDRRGADAAYGFH